MSIEALTKELRSVVSKGVERAEAPRGVAGLRCVRRRATAYSGDGDGLTLAWRDVVRAALDALGDGPYGHAARLLFGSIPDTRGQLLGERRRIAADSVDVALETFRKNREPGLVADVAAEIYRLEHEPVDDAPDGIVAVDVLGIGEPELDAGGLPDLEPGSHTSALRRALSRVRRPRRPPDRDQPGELTCQRIPQVVTFASPPVTQLYRQLEAIRDWQASFVWLAVFLLGGGLIVWRWGLDIVALYVAALAGLGLISTAAHIVAAGRTSRRRAAYEQWPKIILLILTAGLAIWTRVGDDNDVRNEAHSSCLLPHGNPACTSSTTETTFPLPNSVPVTFAAPQEPVEPQCPPADNTERRISFTDVPPRCIRSDATYVATIATNYGDFELTLHDDEAPWTVNNFVFLARWHFYDGVVLSPFPEPDMSSTYLASGDPVERDHLDQAPGYGLTFEQHEGPYPEDAVYAIATNSNRPHRWALVISDDAREQIADEQGAFPILGEVTACRDVIADPVAGDLQPRLTHSPIVIETITIQELPPGSTTSTTLRRDPQCRERQDSSG